MEKKRIDGRKEYKDGGSPHKPERGSLPPSTMTCDSKSSPDNVRPSRLVRMSDQGHSRVLLAHLGA